MRKKNVKLLLACAVLLMLTATALAAYYVWQWQSKFTIQEPFAVTSDLPAEATIYPGDYSYHINVTNNGGYAYNATLTYTVSSDEDVTYTIAPANGTTVTIQPSQYYTFNLTVTVELETGKASGALTINWFVARSEP